MGGTAKVTSKGQITIPTAVREELGIAKGDDIVFYKGLDGQMRIHVRRPRKGAGAGSFAWPDAPKDAPAVREAIDEALAERFEKPE
ncbi:MAG: AbrB/MazE/SpoVT family DNA-binding domain-containing protein [Bauldia sp.]